MPKPQFDPLTAYHYTDVGKKKLNKMAWLTANHNYSIYYEDRGNGPVSVFIPRHVGIADIWHHEIKAFG